MQKDDPLRMCLMATCRELGGGEHLEGTGGKIGVSARLLGSV